MVTRGLDHVHRFCVYCRGQLRPVPRHCCPQSRRGSDRTICFCQHAVLRSNYNANKKTDLFVALPFGLFSPTNQVFQRPTQPAAWWPVRGRSAKWFGCRDGVAGGTWLGISPFGRVGIVTNYRKAHAAIAKGSQQQKSPSNGSYSVALYVSAALFAVAAVATGFFANSHAGLSNAWFAIAATSSLVLAITTVRLQRAMSSPLPQHKTLQGPATPPSRGKLVLQYLTREPNFAPSSASSTTLPTVSNADDFASELEQANLDCYNGFNAIFGDESNKWYYANHSEGDRCVHMLEAFCVFCVLHLMDFSIECFSSYYRAVCCVCLDAKYCSELLTTTRAAKK